MSHREALHQLIEELPSHELHAAMRYLQFLAGQGLHTPSVLVVDDPVLLPEPPETPEEQAAWRDYEAHLSKLPPMERELVQDPD